MWWLSFAWLLIGATITNIIVWTPLLLDAALSGTFNGQLQAHAAASADPRAEVGVLLFPAVALPEHVLRGLSTHSRSYGASSFRHARAAQSSKRSKPLKRA